MSTLADIERRAKAAAETRAVVAAIVGELNDGIEALKRGRMKDLKAAVRAAAEQHDRLKTVIEENPDLFVKPRSVVMHGLKLGYRKGSGGVEFDDAERTAALIRKHFPDQFEVLVQTKHKPLKDALGQLTVADLKRVGCTVEDSGDVVFIKPTDSAVDKLVAQLMKSATEDAST